MTTQAEYKVLRDTQRSAVTPVSFWLAIVLLVPMLVSGIVFRTYDITMSTVPMETARQFNAFFVLTEILVILWARTRGMQPGKLFAELELGSRIALGFFLATFWVGGAFFSSASPFALLFNMVVVIHLLFAAAVYFLARKAGTAGCDPVPFAKLATIVLAVFAVMTVLQFSNPPVGRPLDTIEWQFAVPGFISVRLFGACMAPWVAFMAWLALTQGDQPAYRRWIFVALMVSFGIMFWTATRAAILGVAVAGTVAFLYFSLRPKPALLLTTALAVLASAAIASVFGPHNDPVFSFFVRSDLRSADSFSGGRLEYWQATWMAYKTVPWFGAGPGATAWIMPNQFPHIQPHNLVLQFLITWGLPATVFALSLLLKAVIMVHRVAKQSGRAVPFVLVADCLLAISFFDGTFHFAQPLMMWMAAMAMAFAIGRNEAEKSKETPALGA